MTTIVVSLGRNNGTVNPLPGGMAVLTEEQWKAFCLEAAEILTSRGVDLVFDGYGTGIYEGTREQAYTLIGTVTGSAVAGTGSTSWSEFVDGLERTLGLLAYRYGQDSIALTTGGTRFAAAS